MNNYRAIFPRQTTVLVLIPPCSSLNTNLNLLISSIFQKNLKKNRRKNKIELGIYN